MRAIRPADALIRPRRWPVVGAVAMLVLLVGSAAVVSVRPVASGAVALAPQGDELVVRLSTSPRDGDVVDIAIEAGTGQARVVEVGRGTDAPVLLDRLSLDRADVARLEPGDPVQIRMPRRSLLRMLVG